MGKFIGPRFKIIRRLGKLAGLLKINKKVRAWTAGEHAKRPFFSSLRSSLSSDYKEKFLEKQKLRFNYGITEKQLLIYYKNAKKRKGSTEFNLLQLLESRLDSIVFRLGFAPTITAARQYINHGHIYVNFQKVTIPNFLCVKNDIITLKSGSRLKFVIKQNLTALQERIAYLNEKFKNTKYIQSNPFIIRPSHLRFDDNLWLGSVVKKISRKEIKLNVNILKIIEFYSR